MSSDFQYTGQIPQFDEERQGDGLLRIQWRNGEPRLNTPGRFFVPADRLDGFVPARPWHETVETFEDGDRAEGYAAEALSLIAICARRQPYTVDEAGVKTWRPSSWKWAKGDSRTRIHVDLLCMVEGFEAWVDPDGLAAPIVWTAGTIKTAFAIIGGDGILETAKKEMMKPASDAAKKPLPLYGFWLPIATERDAKGGVLYTKTPGKAVTRPVLVLPKAGVTLEWLRGQWVGGALLDEVLIPMRSDYEAWRQTIRTNGPQAGAEDDEAPLDPPASPRRNVPQPIEDDLPIIPEQWADDAPAVPAPRPAPARRKAF